jgi:mannose-6-phosphate isomerase-like protein (cupin superfamily)
MNTHASLDNYSQVAEQWKARGFSCDVWTDHPGQEWDNFVHDKDELLMVLEGELELVIDGQPRKPLIGEEVLIPAKTVHTVRNAGKKNNRWLYGAKKGSV